MPQPASTDVICERLGAAGVITLNRPQALNALNQAMVDGMRAALTAWEHDPAVKCVIVQGAGEKAFCAGGDIRTLHDQGKAGDIQSMVDFWRLEYELNVQIHNYSKPYVALIDGIVMGGGVGVSLHGSHRVAGNKYLFAMPEVGIGFFPDVGASYALPRLPGKTGMWLAITGDRIKAADAVALGLADGFVPSDKIPALRDALIAGDDVDAAIARYAADPGPAPVLANRTVIDACFFAASPLEILARLDAAAAQSEFAAKCAATMRTKSPTSMSLAFEQMKRGAGMTFREAMIMEFRIVSRIAHGSDFYEGVRAVIIDKDNAPRWTPSSLNEIVASDIEAYFAPLGATELAV